MCLGLTCRVEEVDGTTAAVRDGPRRLEVSLLTLDEPVQPGDTLLVHAGFALARLTPQQAADAASLRQATRPRLTT